MFFSATIVSIGNVEFKQEWNGCPRLTWNATNHGLCDVKLFLSFVRNDTNRKYNFSVPVADGIYENWNLTMMNVTAVRYKTIVIYNSKMIGLSLIHI